VREHAREYRVPCLDQTGIPARLVFEFVFRPDERQVLFSEPLAADEPKHRQLLQCISHVSGERPPA
jgi:hypothetical protein